MINHKKNNNLKISFLINRPPPLVGGLQNVCLRVAKRFQEAGAVVNIVGFPDEIDGARTSELKKTWIHDGVEICELRRGGYEDFLLKMVPFLKKRKVSFPLARFFFESAYAKQISRLCQGSQVFHYFGTGMEMNGYAVAKAVRCIGAKLFIDPALHAGQWGDTWLDAPLYKAADSTFCYSQFEAGVLKRLGVSEDKIYQVSCGITFNNKGNANQFREVHGIRGPMVLFLGRKTESKGVKRLLKAWPFVAEKFPEATLVFAGPKNDALRQMADGEWRMAEEKAESGNAEKLKSETVNSESESSKPAREPQGTSLATSYPLPVTAPAALSRILNLDDLTDEEKQDALAACDVLCVPSEGESFGMVYYEAWAYKTPVVALDLPVLRESIGAIEGGLLTDQKPESIAAALVKLLQNPDLRFRLGSNGLKLAQKHDWPLALNSYMAAYRHAEVEL